jgi:hypothetical protein
MGAGAWCSLCQGGCRGSFDLVLLVTHLGEVYCVCTTSETESRLVGKVCDLCRGLEANISVVLTVMSGLGILFDYRYRWFGMERFC